MKLSVFVAQADSRGISIKQKRKRLDHGLQ
jgi:hypothetical protein